MTDTTSIDLKADALNTATPAADLVTQPIPISAGLSSDAQAPQSQDQEPAPKYQAEVRTGLASARPGRVAYTGPMTPDDDRRRSNKSSQPKTSRPLRGLRALPAWPAAGKFSYPCRTLYQKDKANTSSEFIFLVVYLNDKNDDDVPMTREELRRENARKLASGKGGKAAFARLVQMEASQVSQLIGPKPIKNIGNSIARRIERAYDLPEGWLDTEHPELQMEVEGSETERSTQPQLESDEPGATTLSPDDIKRLVPGAMPVRVVDSDDPALTHIPKVKLRLSAGVTGFEIEPERFDGSTTTVPTNWIERNGFSRDRLIATHVKGESMEPTLYEDDLVVVNLADTRPVDGGVYAINYEGEAVIKRLTRDAGQWWLSSDHADQRKYYRRVCKGADCIIVGRVVRRESERF